MSKQLMIVLPFSIDFICWLMIVDIRGRRRPKPKQGYLVKVCEKVFSSCNKNTDHLTLCWQESWYTFDFPLLYNLCNNCLFERKKKKHLYYLMFSPNCHQDTQHTQAIDSGNKKIQFIFMVAQSGDSFSYPRCKYTLYTSAILNSKDLIPWDLQDLTCDDFFTNKDCPTFYIGSCDAEREGEKKKGKWGGRGQPKHNNMSLWVSNKVIVLPVLVAFLSNWWLSCLFLLISSVDW